MIIKRKIFAKIDYKGLDPITKRFKRKKRGELANFLKKRRKEIYEKIKAERKENDLESIKYRNKLHEFYSDSYKHYGNGKNKNNQYSTEQRSEIAKNLNKWRNSNNKIYEENLDSNKQQEIFNRDFLYDVELSGLSNQKDYINKETKNFKKNLKNSVLIGGTLLGSGIVAKKLYNKKKKNKED